MLVLAQNVGPKFDSCTIFLLLMIAIFVSFTKRLERNLYWKGKKRICGEGRRSMFVVKKQVGGEEGSGKYKNWHTMKHCTILGPRGPIYKISLHDKLWDYTTYVMNSFKTSFCFLKKFFFN